MIGLCFEREIMDTMMIQFEYIDFITRYENLRKEMYRGDFLISYKMLQMRNDHIKKFGFCYNLPKLTRLYSLFHTQVIYIIIIMYNVLIEKTYYSFIQILYINLFLSIFVFKFYTLL